MDEDEIRRLWDVEDPPWVGLVMGPGGLSCPIDNDRAEQTEAIIDKLSRTTWVERTPRGGCHVLVTSTEPVQNTVFPGIDCKGWGSLVVVSPSPGYERANKRKPAPLGDANVWVQNVLEDLGIDAGPSASKTKKGRPTHWRKLLEGKPLEEGERNAALHDYGALQRRYGADARHIYAVLMGINEHLSMQPLPESEVAELAAKIERQYEPTYPQVLGRNAQPTQASAPAVGDWVEATDIIPTEPTFHWGLRLVEGAFNPVVGEPGVAKSIALTDIAARFTVGSEWPGGQGRVPQGDVLIMAAEDDASSIVVPRLQRHGADLSKVHLLGRHVDLTRNIEVLREAFKRYPETKLLIQDPVLSYVGGDFDMNLSPPVRQMLHQIGDIVREHNATWVGIIHLNKRLDTPILTRILGAGAFREMARSVLAVVADPESDLTFYLAHLKTNYGRREPTLRLGVEGPAGKGAVRWDGEVDVNVEALLGPEVARGGSPGKLEEARELLRELLGDGSKPQGEIELAFREREISPSTMWRAKKDLPIKSIRRSDHWEWRLVSDDTAQS